jgi:hypothetical protein
VPLANFRIRKEDELCSNEKEVWQKPFFYFLRNTGQIPVVGNVATGLEKDVSIGTSSTLLRTKVAMVPTMKL